MRALRDTLAVVIACALVWGIATNFGRQEKLCTVIRAFVVQADAELGTPASASYDYLQALKPAARARAISRGHEESRALLAKLEYCG